jgi:hypothetical protein
MSPVGRPESGSRGLSSTLAIVLTGYVQSGSSASRPKWNARTR